MQVWLRFSVVLYSVQNYMWDSIRAQSAYFRSEIALRMSETWSLLRSGTWSLLRLEPDSKWGRTIHTGGDVPTMRGLVAMNMVWPDLSELLHPQPMISNFITHSFGPVVSPMAMEYLYHLGKIKCHVNVAHCPSSSISLCMCMHLTTDAINSYGIFTCNHTERGHIKYALKKVAWRTVEARSIKESYNGEEICEYCIILIIQLAIMSNIPSTNKSRVKHTMKTDGKLNLKKRIINWSLALIWEKRSAVHFNYVLINFANVQIR